MNPRLATLLKEPLPLKESIALTRANCFNAVELFFDDSVELGFLGPEAFVNYIQSGFQQVLVVDEFQRGDVSIIWSRNTDELSLGHIRLDELDKTNPKYPYGLIIQHSFVWLSPSEIFHKRGPDKNDPYEIVPIQQALKPYLELRGLELTRHRRKPAH